MRHAVMRDADGIYLNGPAVSEKYRYCRTYEDCDNFSRDPELIPTCAYCRAVMAKWHEDGELIRRSLWLRGRSRPRHADDCDIAAIEADCTCKEVAR